MNNVVIKVEGLSKKYLIKHEDQERYQTFQNALLNGSKNIANLLNLFQKKKYNKNNELEDFWAQYCHRVYEPRYDVFVPD